MNARAFYLLLLLALAGSPPAAGADEARPPAPVLGDALLPLLEGEFALQQGDSAAAAVAYVEAAKQSSDPSVAERAARVALLADERLLLLDALKRWRELDPKSLGGRQFEQVALIREQRFEEAAEGLVALMKEGEEGQRLAIQALAGSGTPALEVLSRVLDAPGLPAEFGLWVALGGLAQQWGDADLAARVVERAGEVFPEDRRVGLWRAEVLLRQQRTEAAGAALDAVLALGLTDIPERLRAASLLDGLGQPERAAELLAEGEQSDATFAGRAAYLARLGESDALQALYGLIKADAVAAIGPESGAETTVFDAGISDDRRFLLGQIAEVLELGEEALRWYSAVSDPARRLPAQLRIAVLHEQAGRGVEAIETLQAVQGSDSEDGETLRNAFLLEAELLNRRGELLPSIDALNRGLQIFEDDRALLYARALTYERLDRVPEAIIDLQVLVTEDPEDADALNALGYTMADRTAEYEEALGYIERALALSPEQPAILDSMGWVLFKLGRHQEALDYLQRAFAAQEDAEIAAHLAEVLAALGREEEAREIWQKGAGLDPDNRAIQRLREQFGP
ncbi:tetratricopeptide repeat protein [Aquimonas voraii]|uniref:Tetratricopeptide repeat-containing protein n=1 Tax=Aquimonas voraii TaxID=265719 RepID=A0A1G6YDR7_9GAMM|nr:tetratricopeptide repeat protein [Aquimonas voraii]SDD88472.1 Tetratricopeptide repeat-containing protein [Aquimonas voraii]